MSKQLVNCVTYLNQFLPSTKKLDYLSFDMSKHSKKNADVIGPLQTLANSSIKKTGFFKMGGHYRKLNYNKELFEQIVSTV